MVSAVVVYVPKECKEDKRVLGFVKKLGELGFSNVQINHGVNQTFNIKCSPENAPQAQVIANLIIDMTGRVIAPAPRPFRDNPKEEDPEGTRILFYQGFSNGLNEILINLPFSNFMAGEDEPKYRTDMFGFKTCDENWNGKKPLSLLW